MRKNEVREKLLAGRPVLGAMLGLGSPNAAELMAMAGYDFLIIETEHNGLDSAEVEHMLMAIGQEAVPVVRVPSADPVFILGQTTGSVIYIRNLVLLHRRGQLEST